MRNWVLTFIRVEGAPGNWQESVALRQSFAATAADALADVAFWRKNAAAFGCRVELRAA